MLYIHTIKNDQKIGKFFEPTNTEASKDLADSFEKNQDLESIAKNLIAK